MSQRPVNGRALLLQELERAAALEGELHELVSKPRRHAGAHPSALDWFERLERRVFAHGAALEDKLDRLTAGRQPLTGCPIRLPETPGSELTRDLDSAYALLSAAIASYVVVTILAGIVGDLEAVTLAQANGDDANAFLEELDAVTVRVARQEALDGAA
jgi:hypothetical protein